MSVKTRIGFEEISLDTWLPFLFSLDPPLAAVTLHLRTRKGFLGLLLLYL